MNIDILQKGLIYLWSLYSEVFYNNFSIIVNRSPHWSITGHNLRLSKEISSTDSNLWSLATLKRIANDFNFEAKCITKEILSVGFPKKFIRNTIEYFIKDIDGIIIPELYEQKLIFL